VRSFSSATAILFALLVAGTALPGCSKPESTPSAEKEARPTTETTCDDGKDEDGDGEFDCDDRDCAPSNLCQIALCRSVCAAICECETIAETCTAKELAGVLAGCQKGCSEPATRSQVTQADGVPCFVIAGLFLERVQSNGICLGGAAPPGET
jgi:hypothetical protein